MPLEEIVQNAKMIGVVFPRDSDRRVLLPLLLKFLGRFSKLSFSLFNFRNSEIILLKINSIITHLGSFDLEIIDLNRRRKRFHHANEEQI